MVLLTKYRRLIDFLVVIGFHLLLSCFFFYHTVTSDSIQIWRLSLLLLSSPFFLSFFLSVVGLREKNHSRLVSPLFCLLLLLLSRFTNGKTLK